MQERWSQVVQKLHKTKSQARKTQAQNTKNCHLCAGEVEPGGAGVARDKITNKENTNTKHKKTLSPLCRIGGTRWCRSCTRSRAANSRRGSSRRRTGCSLMCLYATWLCFRMKYYQTVLRIACREAQVIALIALWEWPGKAKGDLEL